MALIQINADFTRLVEVMTEIRDILARACPPVVIPEQNPRKRGVESIVHTSPERRLELAEQRELERIRKEERIDEVEK